MSIYLGSTPIDKAYVGGKAVNAILKGTSNLLQSTVPVGPMKSIITVGTTTNADPSNTTVKYTPLCGGSTINGMWQSASSRPDIPICAAGTFSNLVVRLPLALTGTQSWTFTLVKNGVDTGLTVTITSAGLVEFDNVNTVDVIPGDTVALKSAPTNTPTAQGVISFGLLFTAASGQVQPLFATFASGGGGDIAYGTFGTINSGVQMESSRRAYAPTGGTITTLRIGCNNAPGAGGTRTITLMKNGVDVLTATIDGTNTTGVAVGSVHFNAGDLMQLRREASAGVANSLVFVGADWNPDAAGEAIFFSAGTGNFDSLTTLYQSLTGTSENDEINEADTVSVLPVACSLARLRTDMNVAPGVGASRTITVRSDGADTAATVVVNDNATIGIFNGAVPLAAGALVDWSETPTGNPLDTNPLGISGILKVA